MSAYVVGGPRVTKVSQDPMGWRDYTVVFTVFVSNGGAAMALQADGLPRFNDLYNFGSGEVDVYAYCHPGPTEVTMRHEGEPNQFWDVSLTFSTKPVLRCQDSPITNPLLLPDRISGNFTSYQQEIRIDRNGVPVLSSSYEPITGPEVEFDFPRVQVIIEQNRAALELPLLVFCHNRVNSIPLWGMPPRTIKCSVSWQRLYAAQCFPYFQRRLTFEIRYEGFDRNLFDQGTKALYGQWDNNTGNYTLQNVPGTSQLPDPTNPTHFIRYTDRVGQYTKTLLNGIGLPAGADVTDSSNGLGPPYYMSISNTHTARDITNANKWVRLATDPKNIPTYVDLVSSGVVEGERFHRGALRNNPSPGAPNTPIYWLVKAFNGTTDPPSIASTDWLQVSITDKGAYDRTSTAYAIGDYVGTSGKLKTGVGIIHVEAYGEADFRLLGIPLSLEQ